MVALYSVAAALLLAARPSFGQVNKENSLTPDAYYHNRYHALLSMAAYGDYATTCPNETFTQEAMLRNFPDSTRPPWTLINSFGPTPSGAQGFTAIVPEMNKALIIFAGNYTLEQELPTEVTTLDNLNENLFGICNYFGRENGWPDQNCTVNSYALQGYLEAKNETNNWEAVLNEYNGAGLVFSIAGHGLGGMHSLIAAMDLNHQNVAYYHHTYGTPRTFNGPAAWYYNFNFWGESGERGIANNDQYTEVIPASDDYAHAGTPFYCKSGWNNTASGPQWTICWDPEDPSCAPRPQGNSTPAQDHYFYFSNVGGCGGDSLDVKRENYTIIDSFISQQQLIEQSYDANMAAASIASANAAAQSSASIAAMASEAAAAAQTPGSNAAAQQTTSGAALARPVAFVSSIFAVVGAFVALL